jgi:hypothetical protein
MTEHEDVDISPMDEAAIGLFEMYQSLQRAGFKRRDALTIITKAVTGIVSGESDE